MMTLKVLKELSPKESISQTFTLLPISEGLQVGVVMQTSMIMYNYSFQ